MGHRYIRWIVFFSLLGLQSNAQQLLVQTIKGSVADRFIKTPLAGATIEWIGAGRKISISDGKGNFTLSGIPVGRQSIKISHVGYKPITLNNLQVESGKELVIAVEMEDDLTMENEIIVKARSNKGRPINEMAMVSGRMFSVEETRRFAAGLNDPSRIATAFAGVTAASGDGNALVIRGNAPNGLLWRMEGIDIPNPNHLRG